MSRLASAFRLLFPANHKRAVAAKWLFLRPSLLDSMFAKKVNIKCDRQENFKIVNANGESYVWPGDADTSPLIAFLSELKTPNHPHQYLYGKTQIQKHDVVIDIGACEGGFSARAAEMGAKAIVVEPSNIMTAVIRKLFEIRSLKAPTIANVLLGPKMGELHFVDNPQNPGASRVVDSPEHGSYVVPVWTIDYLVKALQLEKVDYIKCDAEGADVGILKGAEQTLKCFRPKIAVTTYHNSTDYSELFSYLEDLGYDILGKGLLYTEGEYRVLMLHAW